MLVCRSGCVSRGWLVYGIFFCKQKTAYEMRISDWSSDVCSSDLPGLYTTHFVPGKRSGPHLAFYIWQTPLCFLGLRPQLLGTCRRHFLVGFRLGDLFGAMRLLVGPFLHLLLQLPPSRLHAIARVNHVTNFGLKAADLSTDRKSTRLNS